MSEQLDVSNLDALVRSVDKGADRLRELMDEFEGGINPDGELIVGVRALYEYRLAEIADRIFTDYETADPPRKPPSEAIRLERARQEVQAKEPNLYARYHALAGSIKTGQKWLSAKRDAISGLQTLNKTGAQLAGTR